MLKNLFTKLKSKWQEIIAVASLLAMIAHFVLKFTLEEAENFPLIFLLVIGGAPLMIQIFLKTIKGDFGADLLAFIALITAVYLDEYLACALIILMLSSGQALERYGLKKASFALEALAKRMPSTAHKIINGASQDVEISQIKIGDLIEIYPHETCPVDGTVVEGQSQMDESYLTGEPYHISKISGSSVLSGAINGESKLIIRADKLPQDSRYANIMKVMQNAESNRPQMRRMADQIGAIFAPVSMVFAILVFYFTGSAERFLSVLVVATPCPLLIAIPISIISAISIAARRGIIIRDPIILEKLPTCTTAIFDKTGTLTYGKAELTKITTLNNFDEDYALQLLASVEKYSRHPLANAINDLAVKRNIKLVEVQDVSEKAGQGLSGHVDGKEILITSRKKINSDLASSLPATQDGLECIALVDGKVAAIFYFRDEPRADGHFFITHLGPHHNFKKIMLVSGDRSSEVDYLAKLLGIKDSYASQTPEQKLKIVREENMKAPTLFMGDGINDAPALAAATAGIAFGQHNESTSQAAGAVIMENSLAKVDELFHISENLRSIALQSAIGGMSFSLVGMILAAFGFINPVQGALLQEVIDVVAILNSLRLTWKSSIETDIVNMDCG